MVKNSRNVPGGGCVLLVLREALPRVRGSCPDSWGIARPLFRCWDCVDTLDRQVVHTFFETRLAMVATTPEDMATFGDPDVVGEDFDGGMLEVCGDPIVLLTLGVVLHL